MRKVIVNLITAVLIISFVSENVCYGLATLPASQNPTAKREILAALERTQIRYAESEDAVRLLRANNASCLLLSSGKYLVTKEVAEDDIRLLRAIIHEDIEAIMQIISKEDRYRYQGIKELVLKHFPPDLSNRLPVELYVNHTIARAFEWLCLIEDGIILKDEIPPQEAGFISSIRPIINTYGHSYFTREFWDSKARGEAIRAALNDGARFYQVAGAQDGVGEKIEWLLKQEPSLWEPPKSQETVVWDREMYALYYDDGPGKCEELKAQAKRCLEVAYEVAPFLNEMQRTALSSRLDALARSAKDFRVNYGGSHKGEEDLAGLYSYADIRELIDRVRDRLADKTVADEDYLNANIVPLGNDADAKDIGNKARSFVTFNALGLPYPAGFVIKRSLVERILGGDDAIIDDVVDRIIKLFDIKEVSGRFDISVNGEAQYALSVRSSPEASAPGAYSTELDIVSRKGLRDAIKAVAESLNTASAQSIKKELGIPPGSSMAIIVQGMVHGDINDRSGAGVVFSRNPNTGEPGIYGNFKIKGTGRDIVSGQARHKYASFEDLKQSFPDIYDRLRSDMEKLEKHLKYPQEVEFVIENGILYYLQTRDLRFTPQAEVRYIGDAVRDGTMSELAAIPKLEKAQDRASRRKVYKVKDGAKRSGVIKGTDSSGGAMAGRMACTIESAEEFAAAGNRVMYIINDDTIGGVNNYIDRLLKIPGIGVVCKACGNPSSHWVVLARLAGIPVIFLDEEIKFEYGGLLAMDSASNEVFTPENMDILAEDTSALDPSYGVSIDERRAQFVEEFRAGRKSVKPDEPLARLMGENVAAWMEFRKLSKGSDKKATFFANLDKHFLHELLLQKARQDGVDVEMVQARLKELLVAAEMAESSPKTSTKIKWHLTPAKSSASSVSAPPHSIDSRLKDIVSLSAILDGRVVIGLGIYLVKSEKYQGNIYRYLYDGGPEINGEITAGLESFYSSYSEYQFDVIHATGAKEFHGNYNFLCNTDEVKTVLKRLISNITGSDPSGFDVEVDMPLRGRQEASKASMDQGGEPRPADGIESRVYLASDEDQTSGRVMAADGTVYEVGGMPTPHSFGYSVNEGHIFRVANTHYGTEETEIGLVQIYHYGEPGQRARIFRPQHKDGAKQRYGKILAVNGQVYQLCESRPYERGCRVRDGVIYETPASMEPGGQEREVGRVKTYYYDEYEAMSDALSEGKPRDGNAMLPSLFLETKKLPDGNIEFSLHVYVRKAGSVARVYYILSDGSTEITGRDVTAGLGSYYMGYSEKWIDVSHRTGEDMFEGVHKFACRNRPEAIVIAHTVLKNLYGEKASDHEAVIEKMLIDLASIDIPRDEPEKNRDIQPANDAQSIAILLTDHLYARLQEDKIYEIKYDIARLTASQIAIIDEYIRLLKLRCSDPDNIRARPFSSAHGSKESLIAVYCTGKDFKGEGHVDVSIPEGELKDYLLRITGMLNIALVSSNIPDNLTKENIDKYLPLIGYIRSQYLVMLGTELAMPDDPADILKVVRRIILGLPKTLRMSIDKIEEYNRLAREALTAA